MADIPLNIQDRIMSFAGKSTPLVKPTPLQRLKDDEDHLTAPTITAVAARLSPSDLFVLCSNEGPGFIVLDKFLGESVAHVGAQSSFSKPSLNGITVATLFVIYEVGGVKRRCKQTGTCTSRHGARLWTLGRHPVSRRFNRMASDPTF
jgi:hypothetical protein